MGKLEPPDWSQFRAAFGIVLFASASLGAWLMSGGGETTFWLLLVLAGLGLLLALTSLNPTFRSLFARLKRVSENGSPDSPEVAEGNKLPEEFHFWRPYIPTWEDEEFRQGGQQKIALLNERRLKPLSAFQDGLYADQIDPGSWGYVDVLHVISPPPKLTVASTTHSEEAVFQVHRLTDGTIELVGFASNQDAHAVRTSVEECRVSIFTRKSSTAAELITIPIQRIISGTSHRVKMTANRLDIRLKPI